MNNKNDNKVLKIILLFVVLAITAGLGYIAVCGVGANKTASIHDINQGLDLAGGLSITYEIKGEEDPSQEDINDTIYKLQMKASSYSTEAQVYQEGKRRITIEIPGVKDADAILKELGKPGSLYFLSQTNDADELNYTAEYSSDGRMVYVDDYGVKLFYISQDVAVLYDETTQTAKLDENGDAITYVSQEGVYVNPSYVLLKDFDTLREEGSIILEGSNVISAKATQQQEQTGLKSEVVALSFDSEGTKAFAEGTRRAKERGETIAIYYDGRFISVPGVSVVITDGNAVITGQSSHEEANRLATQIRLGALKLELEELRSNIVGAQLGSDAISTSLLAGAIGFGIVAVFMIAVYFIPGLSSVLALVLYTILVIITLSLFDITLTLPGIAGIILSIGMAVDANVIVFARIREELATGKTIQSSVDIGFKKATSAILDGNVTTLIASVVLVLFGSGTVRGFAQTLMIGIIFSMFTAMIVTRVLLNGFIALGIDHPKMFGIGKQLKTLDFVSKGKIFVIASLCVILIGAGFMAFHGFKDKAILDFGLEFKGGSSTNIVIAEDLSVEEIDAQIVPGIEKITGDGSVQVQKVQGSNEIIIKTRELSDAETQELREYLVTNFGGDEDTFGNTKISSTISNEMLRDSIIAIVIAVVCMLLYIWIRFSDFRFGVSSILCLVHDVLIVLAFYGIARISVGNTFIACILTIVGYSINATIVVFDRIRESKKETLENMKSVAFRKKSKKNGEALELDFKKIVNQSISQTLSRSIFTSLTTFIMVAVLYVLGVTSIKEFALPLMIGIVCGTYSSVCLAGSIWFFLHSKFKPATEEDEDENYV